MVRAAHRPPTGQRGPTPGVPTGELSEFAELNPFAELTDEDLTALALADAETPLGADAVPLIAQPRSALGAFGSWYMPPPDVSRLEGWRKSIVIAVVVTLVVIEALGLCSVFGQVVVG